MAAHKMHLPRD